jgi:hypothetical protein
VTFTNVVGVSDFDGTLTLAKPPQPVSKFYPAGFTNTVTLEGAKYVAPPSGEHLHWPSPTQPATSSPLWAAEIWVPS